MGKLKFKGDTPSKKKRKLRRESSDAVFSHSRGVTSSESRQHSAWTSAVTEYDLNGPCIIVIVPSMAVCHRPMTTNKSGEDKQMEDGIMLFMADAAIGVFGTSKNFELSHSSKEIPKFEHEELTYNRIEPSLTSQVFIINAVYQNSSSRKFDEKCKRIFSLKTSKGEYLAADPKSWKLYTSFTMNDLSLFKLIPHSRNSRDEESREIKSENRESVFWSIRLSKEDRRLCYQDGKWSFVPNDVDVSEGIDKFVIRIQVQNSYSFKQSELEREEGSKYDINNILKELCRHTNGRIKVTGELIKRIKGSIANGSLNEQLIEERERVLSRG